MKVFDKTPPVVVMRWRMQEERREQLVFATKAIAVFVLSFVFGFLARNLF